MVDYQLLNTTDFATTLEKEAIANFLMRNLEDYLDTRDNVSRAIEYALSKFPHQGGFVLIARHNDEIVGITVVNRTNFEGYFAENILVYLAVDETFRRQGVASELLSRIKVYSKGSVLVRLRQNDTMKELFLKSGFEQDSLEFILNR
ncbi:MAG: GNAT family N-acetyltransferase [Flavobacteriales bacterium]|nr:GNAT family N-acetyltransferase [Flavobacteriales bacterium]